MVNPRSRIGTLGLAVVVMLLASALTTGSDATERRRVPTTLRARRAPANAREAGGSPGTSSAASTPRRATTTAPSTTSATTTTERLRPYFEPSELPVETGISGYPAAIHQTLDGGSEGLRGIDWLESMDVPCRFEILQRDLSTGQEYVSPYWARCPEGSPFSSRLEVVFTAERNFVRGIAVCDSRDGGNHRLKGIRLYGAKVWLSTRQIDNLNGYIEQVRPNCGTWDDPMFCPRGMIASGIVVREDFDDGLVTAFAHAGQGISLLCRRVVWN